MKPLDEYDTDELILELARRGAERWHRWYSLEYNPDVVGCIEDVLDGTGHMEITTLATHLDTGRIWAVTVLDEEEGPVYKKFSFEAEAKRFVKENAAEQSDDQLYMFPPMGE